MSTFKNKHVLITGGAGGIGFLMGKKALLKGANKLIIWDVSNKNITQTREDLSQFSDQIITYNVDISDPNQIYRTADDYLSEHQRIDILINNAGVVVGGTFEHHTKDNIGKIIETNLLGAMHTTSAFLPKMLAQKSGHIVNIASAAGRLANPKMSVYAGSKWGLIGWSESLRLELKEYSKLHVTTVEPSYINTGLFEGITPPLLTPLLDPEDISGKIITAVEKNKIHLRAPFMVKILPFLKGILPTKVFDFITGELFQVYHSMDTFTGRSSKSD